MATHDNTIIAWGQVSPDFTNSARIYTLDGAFVTNIVLAGAGGGVETQIATRRTDNHVFFAVGGADNLYEFDENLTLVTTVLDLIGSATFDYQLLQFIATKLWVGGVLADFSTTVYKKNSTAPYATLATYTDIGVGTTANLIEVDPTETYVYFMRAASSTRNLLKRYKFADSAESTLITYGTWSAGTNTGYEILSGAVFSNGDIALLIQHRTANVVDGVELVMFSNAGAVLHTVTLPFTGLAYHVNTRLSYDGSKVFIMAKKGATSQYVVQSYNHTTALVVDDFLISLNLNDGSFEPMPEVAPESIVDGGDDFGDACITASTKIANKALANLGHTAFLEDISTDESAEAEQCRLQYEDAVLEVLNEFPWPFATRYAALELRDEAADDPINPDWRFSYRLPADCVSPRRLCSLVNGQRLYDPNPAPFRRFNDDDVRLLFTNAETSDELPLTLEYTYRPECVATSGDPLFKRALQWYLAALLAPSLSKNKITAAECMAMFQATVTTARNVALNEQQVQANTNAGDAPWISDRG